MKTNAALSLYSDVSEVKGFGPKKVEGLNRLGIFKLADCLELYPRAYEDLRNVKNICDISDGEKCLVRAVVLLSRPGKGFGRKRTLHVLAEDKSGRIEVVFFMAGFLKLEQGCIYNFFGKCKNENGRITMFHPVYSKYEGEEGSILPIYPLTKGLSQKDLRKLSKNAFEYIDDLEESLPQDVTGKVNLCSNAYAYKNLHYPENDTKYGEARYRIVFEELFYLKTALYLSKMRRSRPEKSYSFPGNHAKEFVKSLPYSLTSAQARVLDDVLCDMEKPYPMNRLIQGDVGCGKTVVAEAAIIQAVKNGAQAAFMAPTEILASQHFESLSRDFEKLGVRVSLLIGSMSLKERKAVYADLAEGRIDVVIGTHALISDAVEYKNLGLVITDEQHRFGVSQRESLSKKGGNPDVLVMTATPIPRTLAVVLYADLDISIIDEMPPGRIPVVTKRYDSGSRSAAYDLLISQIKEGRQAYIVAPLIEESDAVDGESAEELCDEFKRKYPSVSCELLHGRMLPAEKDDIMRRFYSGEIKVLISTVVIEVGINVQNASVMLIENQERFGLAQLHQLRGRVGRGFYESYCLLISYDDSEIASKRAEIMCGSSDGFVIAEKDLEMRGPGEFFGYRQHGLPQLRFADPVKHAKIAELAGRMSMEMLQNDLELKDVKNAIFAKKLHEKYMRSDNIVL